VNEQTPPAVVSIIDLLHQETGMELVELRKLQDQSVSTATSLDRILITRGVDENQMLRAFAEDLELEVRENLEGVRVPTSFVDHVPLSFSRAHNMIAIDEVDGELLVACANPLDVHPQDDINSMLPTPVRFVLAPRADITELINRAFRHKADGVGDALGDLENTDIAGLAAELEDSEDLLDSANKAPIIKLVNSILFQALKLRASDIHFQPYVDRMQVRFRIDGILYDMESIPKNAQDAVLSRVKVMGKLDIAERRLPQDGRASVRIGDGEVDVRISLVPTSAGERAVLRLLDKTSKTYTLTEMGLDAHNSEILEKYIK